jgi:hypothetical protein
MWQFFALYIIIDNDITAQRFNLGTFEYWSQQLEIRDMEKADLRQLISTNLHLILIITNFIVVVFLVTACTLFVFSYV